MKHAFPSYNEYKDYLLKNSVTTMRTPLIGIDVMPYLVAIGGFVLLGCIGTPFFGRTRN